MSQVIGDFFLNASTGANCTLRIIMAVSPFDQVMIWDFELSKCLWVFLICSSLFFDLAHHLTETV